MGLSTFELETLDAITKFSASIGFLGVVGMAIMFYRSPASFDNPTGRIILTISATDLLDCFVKFLGRWGIKAGVSSWLCQLQGAGIQMSNLSNVFLGVTLALTALYIVFFKGSIDTIKRYETLIIIACLTLPIPLAIAPLAAQPTPGVPMIGDADQWCWITKQYALYQLYFWFIILWIIFLFNIVAYSLVRNALTRSTEFLLGQKISPAVMRQRMFLIKRMMTFIIAFLVVWTPSTINRIVQLIAGYPVFALSVAQSLVSPTRGMINFIAYYYNWRIQPSNMTRSRSLHDSSSTSQTGAGAAKFADSKTVKRSGSPPVGSNANAKIMSSKIMKDHSIDTGLSEYRDKDEFEFDYDIKKPEPKHKERVFSDMTLDIISSGGDKEDGGRDNTNERAGHELSLSMAAGSSTSFAAIGSREIVTSHEGLLPTHNEETNDDDEPKSKSVIVSVEKK